jgi:hypothetical protein
MKTMIAIVMMMISIHVQAQASCPGTTCPNGAGTTGEINGGSSNAETSNPGCALNINDGRDEKDTTAGDALPAETEVKIQ